MVSLSPEQKRQVTNALDALLLDRVDNLPADTQLAGLGVTEAELFLTPVLIN